jgi:hypothetical protein
VEGSARTEKQTWKVHFAEKDVPEISEISRMESQALNPRAARASRNFSGDDALFIDARATHDNYDARARGTSLS